MTASESIKFMKLFRNEWDKYSKTRNAKALDIAIQALEKQITKKPKKIQILTYIFALCVKEKLLIITLFIAQVAARN